MKSSEPTQILKHTFLLFVDLRNSLGQTARSDLNKYFVKTKRDLASLKIIDLAIQPELATTYKITATPCFVVQRDSGEYKKIIGGMNQSALLDTFINGFSEGK